MTADAIPIPAPAPTPPEPELTPAERISLALGVVGGPTEPVEVSETSEAAAG